MEAHGIHLRGELSHRSPVQMYALVVGVLLTVVGAAGFLVNSDFSTGSAITANSLIVADVNGWMNLVHLMTGLVALYVAMSARDYARYLCLAIGAGYGLLTVWGLMDNTILNMLPVDDATSVIHAAIAAFAVTVAIMPGHDKVRD